jgi:hypothetical protein
VLFARKLVFLGQQGALILKGRLEASLKQPAGYTPGKIPSVSIFNVQPADFKIYP